MKSLYNIISFIAHHPLARKNKIKGFKRFFYYQISKIFNPYPIVYAFTDKTFLIVEKGMSGATGNIYCGLHEFEDMAFLLHFLRPEDDFLDIGANVGSYTILASGHVGSRTKAFEPIPATFVRMKNNIAINFLQEKVIAYNIGIGADESSIKFTVDFDSVNHVMLRNEDENYIEVKIEPLNHFVSDQIPSLIKIDVEGYEAEVLKGAHSVLQDSILKAIIIELNGSGNKYGFSDANIHQQLLDYGFRPYAYDPFKRNLTLLETFGSWNTIYLRDLDFVKTRILNASIFRIWDFSI